MKHLISVLLILLLFCSVEGQNTQGWFDFYGYRSFGKSWQYEGNIGMDVLMKQNGWFEIYFTNAVSVGIVNWYELEGGLEFHKTTDPVNFDVSEITFTLAQRFNFVQYLRAVHLQKPYFAMCLEQRYLWYPEEDTSDNKTRMRLKLGGRFILNRDAMVEKAIYMPFYFEGFFNFNGEAFEHTAEKAKASLGVGYIFDRRWMGEFVYKLQLGRNTLTNDVERSNIIFQALVRYHFGRD
jgi:hypothetical protein